MRAKNRRTEATWLRGAIRQREKIENFGFGPWGLSSGRLLEYATGRATSRGPSLQHIERTEFAEELRAKFDATFPEVRSTWFKAEHPAPDGAVDYTTRDLPDWAALELRALAEMEELVRVINTPPRGHVLREIMPGHGVFEFVKEDGKS